MNNQVRVYLFTGFLDSGKSSFISDTLLRQDFGEDEKTLLVVSEEGEIEYDSIAFKKANTDIVYVDSIDQIDNDWIIEMNNTYHPTQVIFEVNGTWNTTELIQERISRPWDVVQILTVINAQTFNLYFTNMRNFLFEQIRYSNLIICNRCDSNTNLLGLRSNLKASNPTAQIVYEDMNNQILDISKETLPFDISKDELVINDFDYGIFCLDALENPNKYENKKITLRGKFIGQDKFIENGFILGRLAMVCCENDTQLVGFVCISPLASKLIPQEWIEVTGSVKVIYDQEYGNNVPVLDVIEIKGIKPLENEYVSFE